MIWYIFTSILEEHLSSTQINGHYTVFTRIQENANKREPSEIKCLLRKNTLLLISYTQYTQYVTFCLPVC
jgi:hypothetical protein